MVVGYHQAHSGGYVYVITHTTRQSKEGGFIYKPMQISL